MWMSTKPNQKKVPVPELVKKKLNKNAEELIENVLKPKHIKPPPKNNPYNHNYLVDIYSKWYRNYFYLCAKYNCSGPNAISPAFELKFARLEYTGNGKFNISYMRHTNNRHEIFQNETISESVKIITELPHFIP